MNKTPQNTAKFSHHAMHRRCLGVSIVIVLLAIVLLSCMVAYIYNLGSKTTQRIIVQNAADASAAAGSAWVARSFNTVAMDNVAMARLIGLINVLDALPMAVDFSYTDENDYKLSDETAIYMTVRHAQTLAIPDDVLARELKRVMKVIGEPNPPPGTQANADLPSLKELNTLFKNSPDLIPNLTNYNAPAGGSGQIWKALTALDGLSQVTMENMPILAQIAAGDGGMTNIKGGGESSAAILLPSPEQLEIPYKRGTFNDFYRPVSLGLLPVGVDDKITNRGPWDTIMGFRDLGGGGQGGDHRGDPPGWSPPAGPPNVYRTFGPQSAMIRLFWRSGNERYNRLQRHLSDIANVKMRYIWPVKRNDATDATLTRLNDPDYEVDLLGDDERSVYAGLPNFASGDQDDKRVKMDNQNNPVPLCDAVNHPQCRTVYDYAKYHRQNIFETKFLVLDLYSRDPVSTFDIAQQWNGNSAANPSWFINTGQMYTRQLGGWHDPATGPPGGPPSSNNVLSTQYAPYVPPYLWTDYTVLETNPRVPQGKYAHGGYPELGLIPIAQLDASGNPAKDANGNLIYIPQKYYRTRFFLFVGINIGPLRLVSDPYTGFDPTSPDAPAPLDLDHAQIPVNDTQARRKYLSFLGVAQMRHPSPLSSGIFDKNGNALMLSLAQSQVFNNHSFDLWTQMWHSQFQPIDQFSDWSILSQSLDASFASEARITPEQLTSLQQRFKGLETLAPVMLSH